QFRGDVRKRGALVDSDLEKVKTVEVSRRTGLSASIERSPVRDRNKHVVVARVGQRGSKAAERRTRLGQVACEIADVPLEAREISGVAGNLARSNQRNTGVGGIGRGEKKNGRPQKNAHH